MSTPRPGPFRWLAYAYGAGLPERYDEWVLHDTTTRTWALRHFARAMTQLAPFIVLVLAFVPGAFWIRLVACLGATALALIFSFAYAVETIEHRLVKAGYASGTGEIMRRERAETARTIATAERLNRIAARRARRAAH